VLRGGVARHDRDAQSALVITETLNLLEAGSSGVDARQKLAHSREVTSKREAIEAKAKVVDLRVAQALRAMRQEPSLAWDVRRLAKLAGASRASFARLFQAETGMSPKRWLRAHRLQLAAERLRMTSATLAVIARHVGYVSEFSLSRAFKRYFGMAPAQYRSGRLTPRCAA